MKYGKASGGIPNTIDKLKKLPGITDGWLQKTGTLYLKGCSVFYMPCPNFYLRRKSTWQANVAKPPLLFESTNILLKVSDP